MANPMFYLDPYMDACGEHGIESMRYTPPADGGSDVMEVRNLDHWACSECGFKPSDIDWVAIIKKEQG